MTTPNINNKLALPFKKRPVTNREQFRGIWSEKKAYVGRVGGKGASYQENKAERRSMEWPWPVSPQSSPIQKVFRMLFNIFYAAELIFYERKLDFKVFGKCSSEYLWLKY